MKFVTLVAVASATVGFVAAQHGHTHHHLHKRAADPEEDHVVFEFLGHEISPDEAAEGLKNGTMIFAPDHDSKHGDSDSHPDPIIDNGPAPVVNTPDADPIAAQDPAPSPGPAPAPAPTPDSAPGPINAGEFPDNTIPCNEFPSAYGAIPIPWVGLGGWSGIQFPQATVNGLFDNIMTMVADLCLGPNCCKEGAFCAYACPPGQQKTQWPTAQGATGQSIGGLLCKNGKLQLTNPGFSKSLCMGGTDKVKVQVKNNMGVGAAVCRTDYPGTEGMTIPVDATPGSTNPLTCPDADNYYNWQGKVTSAQYYVNPKGVSVEDGCKWGSPDLPRGNYAPVNLGVGYSNGAAWLSIFQNLPTTTQKLDFNVELVGDNGGFDNFVGKCKYENGQFCSGDNYENCSGTGCTVNVQYGTATYNFY